jgi:hypothetical protein
MVATYSDLLRLTKQATGDNNNTWGTVVNAGVIELLEDAIATTTSIDTGGGGTITLTSNNGATDEARSMILDLGGTPGASTKVEVPAVSKIYVVKCCIGNSNTVSVAPTGGGTGIDFVNGDMALIYCDGVNMNKITADPATLANLGITASAGELNILDGATLSVSELNVLDGITASVTELNILDGVTASATEINVLDGVTVTVDEINYLDGVTSPIQEQLDGKISSTNSGHKIANVGGRFRGANGSITTSWGISSVTRTAKGRYTVTYTSAFASTYAGIPQLSWANTTVEWIDTYGSIVTASAAGCKIKINNGVTTNQAYDASVIYITVTGSVA